MENIQPYIPMLIFLPLLIGSVIGLAFVMMLIARLVPIPYDKPNLFNRIARTLKSGNRDKAILLLEEDNHPLSNLLSFTFKHSANEDDDLKGIFEYASLKMEKQLTMGTRTLVWLTLWVPLFTILMYVIVPERPTGNLLNVLIFAIVAEVVFWNVTLVLVKLKARTIIDRGEEHFEFLSEMLQDDEENVDEGLQSMADETEDVIDLSPEMEMISRVIKDKSKE